MNIPTSTPYILASLMIAASAHAQTTWTGSVDNDFSNGANWSDGSPNNSDNPGTINSGAPSAAGNYNGVSLDITGGVLDTANGGFTRFQNASTVNLETGGTINVIDNSFQIGGTSELNLNGGSFTGAGTLWVNIADSVLNVNASTDMGGVSIWQRGGNVVIDNATLTVGDFNYSQGTTESFLTLQNGATLDATTEFDYASASSTSLGLITFTDGANALQAAAWNTPGSMNFNFTDSAVGSTITITTGFYSQAEWETKWADGQLTFNGSNTGSFGDYFTVSGDTLTLSSVPEPSTYALLLALGVLGFVYRQRRK